MSSHHRVAIIGAGFGGIGMSIALAREGVEHVIFERRGDVGGTWLANTYPGCRCDVPSHLYSFSFALNPDWSHTFSEQPEIWRYLRKVADEHGVTPRVRFNETVSSATWNDSAKHWELETTSGLITADVLIGANGGLAEPKLPDIPGLAGFTGRIVHSARWDPSYDVAGQRVAVIGTGASGVQIVPNIQPKVKQLYVFQRTPAWVLPHRGRPIADWERRIYRRMPIAQKAVRRAVYVRNELVMVPGLTKDPRRLRMVRKWALDHLEAQVADPELRAKLTPHFTPGCKRLTPSNDYLPALTQPNTELVTDGIREIRGNEIIACDGTSRTVDTIVLATGFYVTDNPFASVVTGRDGKLLRDVWDSTGMAGYLGTTVSGFPNFFMVAGPNTGIGHTSLIVMIEAQMPYIVGALRLMRDSNVAALDVRPDVQATFNEGLQRKLARSVWNTGGCQSWYLDKHGRNTTIWPDFTWKFTQALRRFDVESYYQQLRPPATTVDPYPLSLTSVDSNGARPSG